MKFYSGFLIGLQSADVYLTKIGLDTGYFHEGNSIGAWLLHYGIFGLAIAKLISTAIVFTLIYALRNYRPLWARNFLVYSCALMSIIVVYNCLMLMKVLN